MQQCALCNATVLFTGDVVYLKAGNTVLEERTTQRSAAYGPDMMRETGASGMQRHERAHVRPAKQAVSLQVPFVSAYAHMVPAAQRSAPAHVLVQPHPNIGPAGPVGQLCAGWPGPCGSCGRVVRGHVTYTKGDAAAQLHTLHIGAARAVT